MIVIDNIIDYIIDMGVSILKDKIDESRLRKDLKFFIEKRKDIFNNLNHQDEIDYPMLSEYITEYGIEEIKSYILCTGSEKQIKDKLETIKGKAKSYARANSVNKEETVFNFIYNCIEIIKDFCISKLSDNEKIQTQIILKQLYKILNRLEQNRQNILSFDEIKDNILISIKKYQRPEEKILPQYIISKDNIINIDTLHTEITKLFNTANRKRHLLLYGEGGIGKTCTLLYLWSKLLEDSNTLVFYVPAVILSEKETFTDYIFSTFIRKTDFSDSSNRKIALQNMAKKDNIKIIFLIDGYNEMKIDKNISGIYGYIDNQNIQLIITSKIIENDFRIFTSIKALPLNYETAIKYLDDKEIEYNEHDNQLAKLIRLPMMLTMFAESYNAVSYKKYEEDYSNINSNEKLIEYYISEQLAKINNEVSEYSIRVLLPIVAIFYQSKSCKYNKLVSSIEAAINLTNDPNQNLGYWWKDVDHNLSKFCESSETILKDHIIKKFKFINNNFIWDHELYLYWFMAQGLVNIYIHTPDSKYYFEDKELSAKEYIDNFSIKVIENTGKYYKLLPF